MKRKNLDYVKTRRFLKKSKFSETLNSSSYLYIKLFFLWFLVVLTDFLIEFRFEYLWPLYLLLKNIYVSFKYQGLAFSALFVFITITSDMICFFLIPVQWLFFTASTYIWLQYVWNSEKGICLQTLTVWLIFVYIEATVRLKELKSISSNLNICRTFAAQCIGYPFVTLGFGFKKYINYKIMLRRKKDVNVKNELLFFSIQKSLSTLNHYTTTLPQEQVEKFLPLQNKNVQKDFINEVSNESFNAVPLSAQSNELLNKKNNQNSQSISNKFGIDSQKLSESTSDNKNVFLDNFSSYFYNFFINSFNKIKLSKTDKEKSNSSLINNDNLDNKSNLIENNQNSSKDKVLKFKKNENIFLLKNFVYNIFESINNSINSILKIKNSKKNSKKMLSDLIIQEKDELIQRLENDSKKIKTELQISRELELDLKEKLNKVQENRNEIKYQCIKLENDNNALQSKLKNLNNVRKQEKNTITTLEKKLQEEKKFKNILEKQLSNEKKLKSSKELQISQPANKSSSCPNSQNLNNSVNNKCNNCIETCKQKNQELETFINQLKIEKQKMEVEINVLKSENQSLKKYKESYNSNNNEEVLMNALNAMKERNIQLENSLSAETKLKLELFSVLGETRRNFKMNQSLLLQKLKETEHLKSKISELMAVMPLEINDPYSLIYTDNYISETRFTELHKQNEKDEKELTFEWKNYSENQSIESTSDKIITSKSPSPDLS